MLLKRVKYHNFRPFIGNQEITFTQESGQNGQNVTVILGQNTFGKSTFVLSFICL
jgi:AAA15 family ATPase/GTPase